MLHNLNNTNPPIGKITNRSERYKTYSGQIVEIRWMESSVLENGILRKEEYIEVEPPMRDSCTPESRFDIRECCGCLGLFIKDNVKQCPECGRNFCEGKKCKGQIDHEENGRLIVCASCAEDYNLNTWGRMWKNFWNI